MLLAGTAFSFTLSPNLTPGISSVKEEVPENLTLISEVKRGQSVVLLGTVDRIRDEDEFLLKDSSGKIEIYLGKLGRMPVKAGETVTVHGRADDDVFPGFRPDIYASKLVLADGTPIAVQQWD